MVLKEAARRLGSPGLVLQNSLTSLQSPLAVSSISVNVTPPLGIMQQDVLVLPVFIEATTSLQRQKVWGLRP